MKISKQGGDELACFILDSGVKHIDGHWDFVQIFKLSNGMELIRLSSGVYGVHHEVTIKINQGVLFIMDEVKV